MRSIASRLADRGLAMHPEKPKVVYCKGRNRIERQPAPLAASIGRNHRRARLDAPTPHPDTARHEPGAQPLDAQQQWRHDLPTTSPIKKISWPRPPAPPTGGAKLGATKAIQLPSLS